MKKICSLVVLLAFTLLLVACASDTLTPDQFIDEAATRFGGRASGMSIYVFTNDEILFANSYGYANMAENLAIDDDTVFRWSSITRTLVWISALQLLEQGKLDFHTDIRAYIPDDLLPELKYPTTIFHLLTHSAGWPEMTIRAQNDEGMSPDIIEHFLRSVQVPPQRFQPGEVSEVNSSFAFGVILVSYIVEQVSGMPFYEYVHEHIFNRLEMTHTAVLSDSSDNIWVQQQRAKQNSYVSADRSMEAISAPLPLPFFMLGSAVSTISDFHKFAVALLPDSSGGSALFERHETLEKLHNTFDYDVSSYTNNGDGIIAQNGLTCQTMTLLIDTRRGMGVIVMTNQEREGYFNRVTWLREVIDRFAYSQERRP